MSVVYLHNFTFKTRREAISDWLIAPENPRFALVIANRMWGRAFG